MPGRMRTRLLAIPLLILPFARLRGQPECIDAVRDRVVSTSGSHDSASRSDLAPPQPSQVMLPEPQPIQPFPPRFPLRLPVSPGAFGLPQLVRAAGIIFSGTVIRIEPGSANVPGQAVGSVAITFRVEYAMRGARVGADLSISQWMGLWSSGQRYRVGDRVLLFLYPPSRIGLTSCVGGTMGRFRVDGAGRVLLSGQQTVALRSDPVVGRKRDLTIDDFALAVRRAAPEGWFH